MARAGTVSRVDIERARAALLGKGVNPSLDAIRIELGNTGSKSTIHRYLKEIEAVEIGRLNNEGFLSSSIKELIGRLAAQLQEEALQIVETSRSEFEVRQTAVQTDLRNLQQEKSSLQTQNEHLTQSLCAEKTDHSATKELLRLSQLRTERLDQQSKDLAEQLINLQQHNASLEEKHRNARDALEHFRTAAKEQREQDVRRHENQVQLLQSEIRITNQSLTIKQNEITQLNRDNAQFAMERVTQHKQIRDKELAVEKMQAQLAHAESRLEFFDQQTQLLQTLRDESVIIKSEKDNNLLQIRNLENLLLAAQTELAVKNEVLALLRACMPNEPN